MNRQHYTPPRELSRRTERALGAFVAFCVGAVLAECVAQWAMGWGVI